MYVLTCIVRKTGREESSGEHDGSAEPQYSNKLAMAMLPLTSYESSKAATPINQRSDS
jgi:hypothetical protein